MTDGPYHPRAQEIAGCDHDYAVERAKPHPAPDTETAVEVCQGCGAKHVYTRPEPQRPLTSFAEADR